MLEIDCGLFDLTKWISSCHCEGCVCMKFFAGTYVLLLLTADQYSSYASSYRKNRNWPDSLYFEEIQFTQEHHVLF
jgi:hypothetical protein